jgi:lipoprotein-releasing system permease protein
MNCAAFETDGFVPKSNYLDEDGFHYEILLKNKTIEIETIVSGKSSEQYVGGFEVLLDSWDDLDRVDQIADENIVHPSLISGKPLRVETIKQLHGDIFDWLNFLDVLTYIIIIMMVLVAVINMGSTLLVLILEKTNMIGIMKAFGSSDRSLRKVFLIQATFIVLKGLFWGNVLGIAIVLIQQNFKVIPLNPEVYFMDHVAMKLDLLDVLFLNIGTLFICVVAMMVPVLFILKIKPVKAIKFN